MSKTIALAGNPNTGKTSLFNELTGSNQHVGNWPGVTVERKEGRFRFSGTEVVVVDLPGTYSLGAASLDEQIAADYLLAGEDRPDLAVVVADASNIERSLYLAVQVLETGIPLVLALNMMDMAADKGITIDLEKLSSLLGVSVVPTVARRGEGIEELKETIVASLDQEKPPLSFSLPYGERLTPLLDALESRLEELPEPLAGMRSRTAAVRIVEGDAAIMATVESSGASDEIKSLVADMGGRIEEDLGYDLQTALIERRWGFVSGITAESSRRDLSLKARLSISDRIDRVVTSRWLGLPIFMLVTWAIFWLTYAIGDPLVELLEGTFEGFGEWGGGFWPAQGSPRWFRPSFRRG